MVLEENQSHADTLMTVQSRIGIVLVARRCAVAFQTPEQPLSLSLSHESQLVEFAFEHDR